MTVLLAIASCLVRQSIESLIRSALRDCGFVRFDDAGKALRRLPVRDLGLIVVDLALIEADPRAWLGAVQRAIPDARIMVLAEQRHHALGLECIAAGAHAVVSGTAHPAEIIDALAAIMTGHVRLVLEGTPHADDLAPSGCAAGGMRDVAVRHSAYLLIRQQNDVMRLLRRGHSVPEIARSLELSTGTVKIHLAHAYAALGARSRNEAIMRAENAFGLG